MNDADCRKAFEAFCFFVKQQKGVLNQKAVVQTATKALAEASVADDPEKYIRDIVSITCLLVKDGEEYRFIHKSVQEFYCASWIQQKPEVVARKIYPKLFASRGWTQELLFLKEIDTYHFYKFGLVPAIIQFLEITEDELRTKNLEKAASAIWKKIMGGAIHIHEGSVYSINFPHIQTCPQDCLAPLFHDFSYKPVLDAVAQGQIQVETSGESEYRFPFALAESTGILQTELKSAAKTIATRLIGRGNEALAFIEKSEADLTFDNLLEIS